MAGRAVKVVALAVVAAACLVGTTHGAGLPPEYFNTVWTYNDTHSAARGLVGPAAWHELWGACDTAGADAHQSPVDIDPARVRTGTGGVLPVAFRGAACALRVRNIGATLSAVPPADCARSTFATAAGTTYVLAEAHLHWHDAADDAGTEHTLAGRGAAAEAHLVHYDARFASVEAALRDGAVGNIAVVAVRYAVDPAAAPDATAVPALDTFVAPTYPALRYMNLSATVRAPAVDPYALLGSAQDGLAEAGLDAVPMYHYNGSLTTPPCSALVSWFVVQQPVAVARTQIERLRRFSRFNESEAAAHTLGFELPTNVRAPAPLNARIVYAWPPASSSSSSSQPAPTPAPEPRSFFHFGLALGGSVIAAVVAAAIIIVVCVPSKRPTRYASVPSAPKS